MSFDTDDDDEVFLYKGPFPKTIWERPYNDTIGV